MNVHQGHLLQQLKLVFPNEDPNVNVRKQTQLKYADEGTHYLELDVWYTKHNICFEFQDNYHYVTTWYNQHSTNDILQRDNSKRDNVVKRGISFVAIPCWWDGSLLRLASTIEFECPWLVPKSSTSIPIPLNPPSTFFPLNTVPGVGELMYVSFPVDNRIIFQHAWWLGEKYDGVRCCWNPRSGTLYSKIGKQLPILPQFTSLMARVVIDGELWFGRGSYSLTFMITKHLSDYVSWHLMRLAAFDSPGIRMQSKPFEARYKLLLTSTKSKDPFVFVVARIFMLRRSITALAKCITEDGGEGVVMRRVGSRYEHGRSQALIKIKATDRDSEAVVIGKEPSAIKLQLSNKMIFSVPLENVLVTNLALGDVVSFSYESHSQSLSPVNPVVYRVRTDITWEEISDLYARDLGNEESSTSYWTYKKMRRFMERVAYGRDMDPLQSETWRHISEIDVCQYNRGRIILRHFQGYEHAVRALFPEIVNSEVAFNIVANRRSFFEAYAKENNFDPLVPENWYTQPSEKIMAVQGAKQAVYYYNFSLSKALLDLFPEIGLQRNRLWAPSWFDLNNRRRFFYSYANHYNFDPLDPENWYQQTKHRILAYKGSSQIMFHYGGSLTKALLDIFPDIRLDRSKLWATSGQNTRRMFFENYARDNGFDPLDPEQWYIQSRKKILATENATRVVSCHDGSVSKALLDLFPNIGLDRHKLWSRSWQEPHNRRVFFETYAKANEFDPLIAANWLAQTPEKIMSTRGASQVISYHNSSITKALGDLFPDVSFDSSKKFSASWSEPKRRRLFFEQLAKERGFDPLDPHGWYSQMELNLLSEKGLSKLVCYHKGNITRALLDLFPDIGLDKSRLLALNKKQGIPMM